MTDTDEFRERLDELVEEAFEEGVPRSEIIIELRDKERVMQR